MFTRGRPHRRAFFRIAVVFMGSVQIAEYCEIRRNSCKFATARRCSLRYLAAVTKRNKNAIIVAMTYEWARPARRRYISKEKMPDAGTGAMLKGAVGVFAMGRSFQMERNMPVPQRQSPTNGTSERIIVLDKLRMAMASVNQQSVATADGFKQELRDAQDSLECLLAQLSGKKP